MTDCPDPALNLYGARAAREPQGAGRYGIPAARDYGEFNRLARQGAGLTAILWRSIPTESFPLTRSGRACGRFPRGQRPGEILGNFWQNFPEKPRADSQAWAGRVDEQQPTT